MSRRSNSLIAWITTTVCVVIMCGLGYWQVERMIQKQQRLASIAQKQSNGSLVLEQALAQEDPRDIEVTFVGTPEAARVIYLDNQIHQQQVGFDVVIPVNTNVGWLLVNYGWVPAPDMLRSLPSVSIDTGLFTFSGVITFPGDNPLVKETNTRLSVFPALVQKLDIDAISEGLERQLLPFVIQLTSEDPAFVRVYQPVVMSPQKHLGYALQWFGLAIAAAAIGGFAISKKGRRYE